MNGETIPTTNGGASAAPPSQPDQKVWFVTGTSSGFGKRLVRAILARGDCVVATVRARADFPLEVDDAQRARLHILELDVTEPEESIRRKAAEAVAVWGRVDVLVNNAGNAPKSLLEEGGSTKALEQFNVNFFGQLNVTHAILPYMRDRMSGTVVFFGSRSVWKPDAVMTGYYIASKAAIHAYSETLAAEVARFNVKVLLVAPGHFRTEKLHTAPYVMAHHIPAYDAMREEEMARFNKLWHKARGDTDRAVEVVVDVVRGEGCAAGRPMPFWLLLGNATYVNARAHADRLAQDMDAWQDVAKDLDIQEEQEA